MAIRGYDDAESNIKCTNALDPVKVVKVTHRP